MSTLEESHGRTRATRDRATALPNGPTAEDRHRTDRGANGRFAAGNRAAVGRSAKNVIAGRERAALALALAKSVGPVIGDSEDKAKLLGDVLRLYRDTLTELPAHSAVVLASAMNFARESAVASVLFNEATNAGLTSERGLQLLESAQRAEKRAEQASVHAFAIATRMAGKSGKSADVPWFVEADEPEVKP